MAKKNKESSAAEEIVLDDAYVTAVFAFENSRSQNKPFKIQPFLKTPKEVSWRITGRDIMQTLEKIYNDVPVPINRYIKALKEIRSSIFLYKQLGPK